MGKFLNLLSLSHHQLRMKVNTLENENETLKATINDELYKSFMEKLGEPLYLKRLKDENKKLRKKVKFYREELTKNG